MAVILWMYLLEQPGGFMKIVTLAVICVLMAANVFAASTINLKALDKAISHNHQRTGNDKGSFVMVYGGQDISRGNFKVMNTVDRTILAG
jgi:hypothetical protein